MRGPSLARLAIPCAALAALALASGGCGRSARTPAGNVAAESAGSQPADSFAGALLPAGVRPHGFALTDQRGRRVALSSFRGRVAILAFLDSGSRPATLIAQQIRGALDELQSEAGSGRVPVAALAVSVAPRVDTPARVRAFLQATGLSGRMEYLTGPPARLRRVWHSFRVVPATAGRGAYEQGAFVVLMAPNGDERVELPLEALTPEALAHDVRELARMSAGR
jgi:cytochrome oxidase Cu insertion factor (SCO1/SenC/PrrC family)